MTIAACYINPEGIVLGADSTASAFVHPSGFHYLNHNQKLFEIGIDATLGMVTWGLGSINMLSHRTQIAILADDLKTKPATTVEEVAKRFAAQVDVEYQKAYRADVAKFQLLASKLPYDATAAAANPAARSKDEEQEMQNLWLGLSLGFCIGGFILPDRIPSAFTVQFDPFKNAPIVAPVTGAAQFWGAPKIFDRLIKGYDPELRQAIISSGKWSGSHNELDVILHNLELSHLMLPIRDAVDFIHVCIYTTIKAMKFSVMSQTCGGPIELATITTDRKFRWVRHKNWDSAILDGDIR